MVAVGTTIKERREALGLSVRDVAARARCSGETVRILENGSHWPTLALARRIAMVLGSTVDELWPPVETGEGA